MSYFLYKYLIGTAFCVRYFERVAGSLRLNRERSSPSVIMKTSTPSRSANRALKRGPVLTCALPPPALGGTITR